MTLAGVLNTTQFVQSCMEKDKKTVARKVEWRKERLGRQVEVIFLLIGEEVDYADSGGYLALIYRR